VLGSSLVVLLAAVPSLTAVVPLDGVLVGDSNVTLTLPDAVVELELKEGERQRVKVTRPFEFETTVPNDSLPWVLEPGADATGVVTVLDEPHDVVSLRRVGKNAFAELDLEGFRVKGLVVPLSSVGLRAREPDVYVMDRFMMLSWGKPGFERLARVMTPRLAPSTTVSSGSRPVRVTGSPFWLRAAPKTNAPAVQFERTEADAELAVLEEGKTWCKVSLSRAGLRIEGWLPTRQLLEVPESPALGHGSAGDSGTRAAMTQRGSRRSPVRS
jgi:hypothetical protein